MLWRDAEDAVRFDSCHQRVRDLHAAGTLTTQEYEAYESVASANGITLHYARRDRFERLAGRHFEIESVDCGQDYEASHLHPIYVLVRPAA